MQRPSSTGSQALSWVRPAEVARRGSGCASAGPHLEGAPPSSLDLRRPGPQRRASSRIAQEIRNRIAPGARQPHPRRRAPWRAGRRVQTGCPETLRPSSARNGWGEGPQPRGSGTKVGILKGIVGGCHHGRTQSFNIADGQPAGPWHSQQHAMALHPRDRASTDQQNTHMAPRQSRDLLTPLGISWGLAGTPCQSQAPGAEPGRITHRLNPAGPSLWDGSHGGGCCSGLTERKWVMASITGRWVALSCQPDGTC